MIHPTAILEGNLNLPAEDAIEIGPYAVLRGDISLGEGSVVGPHACLEGEVVAGRHTRIGHGSVVGAPPQDLAVQPDAPGRVIMGENNVLREHVTIHRSSTPDAATTLGNGNFLMTGSHLGHDVTLGDRNILANAVLVAGHVTFGDGAFVGGGSVFHQFIRVGHGVMVQGISGFSLDIPPFVIACRVNELAGLNVVGLRRAKVPADRRAALKKIYDLLHREKWSMETLRQEAGSGRWDHEAAAFLDFLARPSRKGCCR